MSRQGVILKMANPKELRGLWTRQFEEEPISVAEFNHIFKLCNGLWLHSGDPVHPHVELTSGKHSNGFANVLKMLRYTHLCQIMAQQLINKLTEKTDLDLEKFAKELGWVIGSNHAGVPIGLAVAMSLGYGISFDFPDKGPDKTQIWNRHPIEADETILQVEELITTTSTLQAVRDGLRKAHEHPLSFVPMVLCLVHRSTAYEFEGAPIIHLIHYDIDVWEAATCPLCAQGSKAIRPKGKAEWAELTKHNAA